MYSVFSTRKMLERNILFRQKFFSLFLAYVCAYRCSFDVTCAGHSFAVLQYCVDEMLYPTTSQLFVRQMHICIH